MKKHQRLRKRQPNLKSGNRNLVIADRQKEGKNQKLNKFSSHGNSYSRD